MENSLWMDSSVFDSGNKLEISLDTDSKVFMSKKKRRLFFISISFLKTYFRILIEFGLCN